MSELEAKAKLERIEKSVREWVGKQGHDKCHYYPEIFRKIAETLGIEYVEPNLPPREEFRIFCQRYEREIYGERENVKI